MHVEGSYASKGAKPRDGKPLLRTRIIIKMISPWITHLGKSPGSQRDWSIQIMPDESATVLCQMRIIMGIEDSCLMEQYNFDSLPLV
jgi:hypothetical protein